ncbi:MAG: hypothetical protein HY842_06375 [Bacteroidetes bacterium]|nr:hypothetical protein [Bacteroidota bacterium]
MSSIPLESYFFSGEISKCQHSSVTPPFIRSSKPSRKRTSASQAYTSGWAFLPLEKPPQPAVKSPGLGKVPEMQR